MSKSWRSNTQHRDYSQRYCIINFRVAKRLDLNCPHHKKGMIIMWSDRGVSWHHGGNHVVICEYQISMLYISNLHAVICQLDLDRKEGETKDDCRKPSVWGIRGRGPVFTACKHSDVITSWTSQWKGSLHFYWAFHRMDTSEDWQ